MQEYEYHTRVNKGYLFNLSANLSHLYLIPEKVVQL